MNPIFTFIKKVKDNTAIRTRDITDDSDIAKLEQVIIKLDNLPRIMTSRLDDTALNSNPKKWIASLLDGYPDTVAKPDMENLLNDFTDSMKTRMREETKYALGLLFNERLVLCHSIFGEETITPEWKTFPRMLDTDNILRYACFEKKRSVIIVRYWEKEATTSFMEWLGLPRKQAFLFGGKYRLYSEIDGVTVELQLTDEEIERWLNDHPEFKKGLIYLSNPIHSLSIKEIRSGSKRYNNPEDFIQDYEAEKFGATYYQKSYDKIMKDMLPLLMKYYDEETQLVRKEGDIESIELTKSTPGFHILFANGTIEFRASYLAELGQRLIGGQPLKAFHAGAKFRSPPFCLANLELYNQVQESEVAHHLLEYYKTTNLQDHTLALLLKLTIFKLLATSNEGSPFSYVFSSFASKMLVGISPDGILTKLEDDLVEFKSRDILAGKDSDVVTRLVQDISAKLAKRSCEIMLIGVEDSGVIEPLIASRLKSDRVEAIKKALQTRLTSTTVFVIPVIPDKHGLLIIVAINRQRN